MRRGSFVLPASVANATERFKMEADPMRGFIEERIEFTKDTFTPRTEIYTGYTTWATINGFHTMSAQRFYESFIAAAVDVSSSPVKPTVRDGVRGYVGMRLV